MDSRRRGVGDKRRAFRTGGDSGSVIVRCCSRVWRAIRRVVERRLSLGVGTCLPKRERHRTVVAREPETKQSGERPADGGQSGSHTAINAGRHHTETSHRIKAGRHRVDTTGDGVDPIGTSTSGLRVAVRRRLGDADRPRRCGERCAVAPRTAAGHGRSPIPLVPQTARGGLP